MQQFGRKVETAREKLDTISSRAFAIRLWAQEHKDLDDRYLENRRMIINTAIKKLEEILELLDKSDK